MTTQYVGKTIALAKVWADINGRQIDEFKPGVQVKGFKIENGYFWLTSPIAGFTKTQWLDVMPVEITPPPPLPPPSDECPFDIVTVEMKDGTIWQGDQWTKK